MNRRIVGLGIWDPTAREFPIHAILSSFMLPQHRAPPASESLSRLTKSSNPFSKFITRWIILVCIVLVVLWFGGPLVGDIIGAPPEFDYYGGSPRPINNGPPPPTFEDQEIWDSRKLEVREAFKHAWTGYNTRAFPSDELLAVSGGKSNKYVIALPFPSTPLMVSILGIMAGLSRCSTLWIRCGLWACGMNSTMR